jgi:hypothetical protein
MVPLHEMAIELNRRYEAIPLAGAPRHDILRAYGEFDAYLNRIHNHVQGDLFESDLGHEAWGAAVVVVQAIKDAWIAAESGGDDDAWIDVWGAIDAFAFLATHPAFDQTDPKGAS